MTLLTTLLILSAANQVCAQAAERGQERRNEGRILAALEDFRACAAVDCPPVIRTDCERWRVELVPLVPTLSVDLNGVELDGVPIQGGVALPLEPGVHVLRVKLGRQSETRTLDVRPGARLVERFAAAPVLAEPALPVPNERPSLLRPIGLSALGVSAGSAVLAGVLTGVTVGSVASLQRSCAPVCPDATVMPVRSLALAADVAYGVAGVTLVAGLVVFLLSLR